MAQLPSRQGSPGRVEQLDPAVAVDPAAVRRPVDQREAQAGVTHPGVGLADADGRLPTVSPDDELGPSRTTEGAASAAVGPRPGEDWHPTVAAATATPPTTSSHLNLPPLILLIAVSFFTMPGSRRACGGCCGPAVGLMCAGRCQLPAPAGRPAILRLRAAVGHSGAGGHIGGKNVVGVAVELVAGLGRTASSCGGRR